MHVVSGISAEDKDGNWRKLSVSLDETDFFRFVAEKKVPGYELKQEAAGVVAVDKDGIGVTVGGMYKVLQRAADTLLIAQMHREHLIDEDEMKRQLAAL